MYIWSYKVLLNIYHKDNLNIIVPKESSILFAKICKILSERWNVYLKSLRDPLWAKFYSKLF